MAEIISVELSERSSPSRFRVYGGDPAGRDEVHATIARWPGWSRAPAAAARDGRRVSVYSAPVSPVSALSLAGTTMRVDWEAAAHELVKDILEALKRARYCLDRPAGQPHIIPGLERIAMPHQRQAIEAAIHMQGRVLLADDMGLGKTSTSLWACHQLCAARILVICPASVKFNWRNEVKATLDWPCYVIDGTPKRRATILAEVAHQMNAPKRKTQTGLVPDELCVVINYDLLVTLHPSHVDLLKRFVTNQALICDESHYLKSRKAARTKFVMHELAPKAMFRFLLTGTPVRNMVDDLWSQVEIIRPGTWTSYWDFEKRHLEIRAIDFGGKGRPVQKVVGTKDLKGLNAVMNTIQIRRIKEDVLDLPPKTYTYPELELVGDHLRVYKAMKDLAVLELDKLMHGVGDIAKQHGIKAFQVGSQVITPDEVSAALGQGPSLSIWSPQARSAVLAALRCEQIAQGFCGGVPEQLVEQLAKILSKKAEAIPGRPREIIFPDSPKQVWLRENLETLFKTGKRPVVVSRFNAPMFWLKEHIDKVMGRQVMFLHGAISSKQKHEVVASFQDGDFECLLMQVKMAEGFNLHISQDCIFLGRDWSPAMNHQAEGRFHRIGQKGTVNIQIPIVRNTIEKLIHKRLMDKDSDAQQALRTVTIKELKEAL